MTELLPHVVALSLGAFAGYHIGWWWIRRRNRKRLEAQHLKIAIDATTIYPEETDDYRN